MGVYDADEMGMTDAQAGVRLAVQQLDGRGLIVPLVAHDLQRRHEASSAASRAAYTAVMGPPPR